MKKLILQGLENGESVSGEVLITDFQKKMASNGPYVQLTVTDGIHTMAAKKWKSDATVPIGTVLDIHANVDSYKGTQSLNIQEWSVGELLPEEFYKKGPMSTHLLWQQVLTLRDKIHHIGYRKFVNILMLTKYKEEFSHGTAAKSVHHDYAGGLLQHSVEVATIAVSIAEVLRNLGGAEINQSLLITGALLHDIGKVKAYAITNGVPDMTTEGKLYDHIISGVQIIATTNIGDSEDLEDSMCREMLTHCITSHHGRMEWGSPVVPKMIEAELISLADLISARGATYTDATRQATEDWTPKIFALGTSIYTGRKD